MVKIPDNIIAAAQSTMKKYNIPASPRLAQFGLESAWGTKDLGVYNYFGRKSPLDSNGKPIGPYVIKNTREVDKNGKSYYINAYFRKFSSPEESFDDQCKLLATAGAYAKARSVLPDVQKFCNALTGVYATDPNYGTTLWKIITQSGLLQYDKI